MAFHAEEMREQRERKADLIEAIGQALTGDDVAGVIRRLRGG